jgi:hypothetical protein
LGVCAATACALADVADVSEPVTATMATTLAAIRKHPPIVELDRACCTPYIYRPLKPF